MTSNHDKDKIAADAARFIEHAAMQDPPEEVEDLRVRFDCGTVKNPRYDHNEFAKYMMEEEDFATPRDTEELLIYSEGVYKAHGVTFVKERIDHIMDGTLSTLRGKSETLGHITSRTYVDRAAFDSDPDVINLNNGLYHVKTGRFSPHTPEYMSLRKSAVNYDPAAECPNIDSFIAETVEHGRRQTIYEMAGYALMARKTMKRGFILYGTSDSGKTQIRKMFKAFVGGDVTCSVTPAALMNDSHASAELYGAMLNAVDDLGRTALNETGILKAMIGDGDITYNQKNQKAFTFTPEAMVMWCTNTVPSTDDEYLRDKYDIIEFPHVFVTNPKAPEERKKIENIMDTIATPEELSGFFNKAIAAFKEAQARGDFTGSGDITTREERWRFRSTPIAKFVKDRCDVTDLGSLSPTRGFYSAYVAWSNSSKSRLETSREVREYLQTIRVMAAKKRLQTGANAIHCYVGIRVLPEEEVCVPVCVPVSPGLFP